ncbi:MAG: hypothetical protein AAGA48_08305 [Myxococcota bacterium]
MIGAAFQHQLRMTRRSPAVLLIIGLFVGASLYALAVGQRSHGEWVAAVQSAKQEEAKAVAEVRGWFERGQKGPEDQDWIDITQPAWQDVRAGTRLVRHPAPLAGIAAGAVDEAPVAIKLDRWANPSNAEGVRIENPEFSRAASLDLVFVFVLFIPILVGILGLGIGSWEREHAVDRAVAVQAGRAGFWFVARTVVVTGIAATVVVAVCGACVGGARPDLESTAGLVGLAVLYTVFWGGVSLATGATASRLQDGAFSYGLVWALLCVVLPAAMSEWALAQVSAEYAVDRSMSVRTQQYAIFKLEPDELRARLRGTFPAAAGLPAFQADDLPRPIRDPIFAGLTFALVEESHEAQMAREAETARAIAWTVWASPAIALAQGFEGLAGVGQEVAVAFRGHVIRSTRQRITWLLEETGSQRELGVADFEALLRESSMPFVPDAVRIGTPLRSLGMWALAAWALGMVLIWRSDL